jgi:hypothetical protein
MWRLSPVNEAGSFEVEDRVDTRSISPSLLITDHIRRIFTHVAIRNMVTSTHPWS